ncbi:hypothetical protein [Nocardia nepalensis]|uniref:hypothetical protein n=1 Tax=Nocardia nepalensis TaxID=3375448 RepID=UPI003B66B69D
MLTDPPTSELDAEEFFPRPCVPDPEREHTVGHASSVTARWHYIEPAHEGPDARKHLDEFADLN